MTAGLKLTFPRTPAPSVIPHGMRCAFANGYAVVRWPLWRRALVRLGLKRFAVTTRTDRHIEVPGRSVSWP